MDPAPAEPRSDGSHVPKHSSELAHASTGSSSAPKPCEPIESWEASWAREFLERSRSQQWRDYSDALEGWHVAGAMVMSLGLHLLGAGILTWILVLQPLPPRSQTIEFQWVEPTDLAPPSEAEVESFTHAENSGSHDPENPILAAGGQSSFEEPSKEPSADPTLGELIEDQADPQEDSTQEDPIVESVESPSVQFVPPAPPVNADQIELPPLPIQAQSESPPSPPDPHVAMALPEISDPAPSLAASDQPNLSPPSSPAPPIAPTPQPLPDPSVSSELQQPPDPDSPADSQGSADRQPTPDPLASPDPLFSPDPQPTLDPLFSSDPQPTLDPLFSPAPQPTLDPRFSSDPQPMLDPQAFLDREPPQDPQPLSPPQASSELQSAPDRQLPSELEPPAELEPWIQTNPSPGIGSGGQASGQQNAPTPALDPANLAAQMDPVWGDYLADLQHQVRQHWLIKQAEGTYLTVVMLTIERDGDLQDLQLAQPSEDALLDAAVLSAIQQSAPFDPLPLAFEGHERTFRLEVLSGSQSP